MNKNVKEVRFGTKQEAVITPKEGYELEKVVVINTVDNSVVPSEITKTADNPLQFVCSFIQPAGHVTIKPYVKPILYSVTFEVSDECNIVLVEQESMADVEIKSAISGDAQTPPEGNEPAEASGDFKHPQHSSTQDTEEGLNVGDNEPQTNTENETHTAATEPSVDEPVDTNNETTQETTPVSEHGVAEAEENTDEAVESGTEERRDVAYDAANYIEDQDDIEPTIISQKELDEKNESYWQWKEEYDAGRCPEEKFLDIKKRHLEFMDNISSGKIVIQ